MLPGLQLVESPAAESFYLLNSGHLILTHNMCDKAGYKIYNSTTTKKHTSKSKKGHLLDKNIWALILKRWSFSILESCIIYSSYCNIQLMTKKIICLFLLTKTSPN